MQKGVYIQNSKQNERDSSWPIHITFKIRPSYISLQIITKFGLSNHKATSVQFIRMRILSPLICEIN